MSKVLGSVVVQVLLPEVIPVATAPRTVISLPDKPHPITPVVVTSVGNLTNVHVRSLNRVGEIG